MRGTRSAGGSARAAGHAGTDGLVQGSQSAPAEDSLRMVPRGERFPFSICFSSCLRLRRRQIFLGARIEEDDIYVRVKTYAKSEK